MTIDLFRNPASKGINPCQGNKRDKQGALANGIYTSFWHLKIKAIEVGSRPPGGCVRYSALGGGKRLFYRTRPSSRLPATLPPGGRQPTCTDMFRDLYLPLRCQTILFLHKASNINRPPGGYFLVSSCNFKGCQNRYSGAKILSNYSPPSSPSFCLLPSC